MRGRGEGPDERGTDLTAEDIAWRIGAASQRGAAAEHDDPAAEHRDRRPSPHGPVAAARARPAPVTRGTGASLRGRGPQTADRTLLWRDAAGFAAIFLAIALGVQLGVIGGPSASSSSGPTQLALGATGTPEPPPRGGAGPAVATIGPVVDPGLGLDPSTRPRATRPGVTSAATSRPPARPAVSASPVLTPAPSASGISAQPSPGASAEPTTSAPPPSPTPAPPVAALTCEAPLGSAVACHDLSTEIVAGSEVWATSDGTATFSPGSTGSATVTITFSASGTFTVTVTVRGLDGSSATSPPTQVVIP